MTNVRLSRIFWISAAVILIAAALVSVASILRGDFGETDAKILGTLAILLLASAAAISGLALVERGVLVPFGWTAVVLAALCFLVVGAAIWTESDSEELWIWAGRAIVLLIALLLVATQRLLLRVQSLVPLVVGTAVSAALATFLTVVAIGGDGEGPGIWQAAAIFWIATALGYLLLPVLQRFTTAGVPETAVRVLAELDGVELVATRARGGFDPGLAPGESLLLRRRS